MYFIRISTRPCRHRELPALGALPCSFSCASFNTGDALHNFDHPQQCGEFKPAAWRKQFLTVRPARTAREVFQNESLDSKVECECCRGRGVECDCILNEFRKVYQDRNCSPQFCPGLQKISAEGSLDIERPEHVERGTCPESVRPWDSCRGAIGDYRRA